MASEIGVLPIPEEKIVKKWRLQPGKMFLIDLEQGRIIDDAEIKEQLAAAKPYQQWLDATQIRVEKLPPEVGPMAPDPQTLLDRQQAFGYTQEDVRFFLQPMGLTGEEPVGSMGRDMPLAVLSDRPKMLYDYFKQCFAQVTNPPIDPIREELVMSLVSLIGPRPNLLEPEGAAGHKRLEVRTPILSNVDLERIRRIENHVDNAFRTYTLDITYPVGRRRRGHGRGAGDDCSPRADRVVREGYNILILSDRGIGADRIAIPALLATAGVHHHLIREGLRTSVGLVVETGEAREVHDFCLLAGYGAEAINPYLAFDTLSNLLSELPAGTDRGGGAQALHQGGLQGHPQGHVEDGHLDLPVLLRRADLRCDRPVEGVRRHVLHRHPDAGRGRRPAGDRRGDGAPAPAGLRRRAGAEERARRRRRDPVPAARRGAHVDAGDGRAAAACHAFGRLQEVQGLHRARSTIRRAS